jgi:anti-sigma regulatory factor (Ser/Thr protein kinase)
VNRLHFHPIRGKALAIVVIRLVTEELVVNIVDYAYPDSGDDYLDVEIERNKEHITLCFRDGGVPFNPLDQAPPDISLPMEQRRIGGLGILIVIKKMDSVAYEYIDGENVLAIMKKLKN